MKEVLIIGLGNRGKKYLKYFLDKEYFIIGSCETISTKEKIEKEFGIQVEQDYCSCIKKYDFDIIISALPINIQGDIVLEILEYGYNGKLIIESPITFNKYLLEKIKEYNNVIFFLEEYYSLLGQFFRRVDITNIKNIIVDIYINKKRFNKIKSRNISIIHINNHFLNSNIKLTDIIYNIHFHLKDDVFYNVSFFYFGKKISYTFGERIFLEINNKRYNDNLSFIRILTLLLDDTSQYSKDFTLYYNLK